MKKSLLFSFMVAGLVMMSSCTKEKVIVIGGDDSNAAQQIVLQVANTGDGLQTRAGRPLYSSEAKQTIENVKVIICNEKNVVKYVRTVENWNSKESSTEYTTGGHGRMTTIEIPKGERLNEDGEYTVYAFGYHNGTAYENLNDAIAKIATGSTFDANTVLKIAAGVKGEEIFAGSITFKLKKEIGFKRPVVLNRQVAGTFGYFEAVPYFEGATKLQLVAPQRNTNLVLGEFANFDLLSNGENDGHIKFVVNGTQEASDNVIYEIELSKWFKELKDDNKDGLIDYDAANWQNPYTGNANFKTGSVFGGTFLIPFAKVGEKKTFVLKLTDNTNTGKEYATWTVKLPTGDKQTAEYTLASWDPANHFDYQNSTDNADTYSVVRNHLYGIGERALDNPENPDKPTPDPSNPDKPEPLNKKQELTLRVNDNWEVIHKMEIEQD